MRRVNLIVAASALAVLAVLPTGVAAQETNASERTFLTFSGTVEMPGVTLPAGTYVFKLADSPSRNVVQVWDREEKDIIGQWLFVQSERPEVTGENVVMFREAREGTTPAVQYWYFPGEKIGKEFIYPRDQAARIAQRTGAPVRAEDGIIEGPGAPPVTAAAEPAPAAPAPEAVTAQVETPAPQAEAPRPVGTSGALESQVARAEELPRTASPLALSGLLGLLSLAGAMGLRAVRK